MWHELYGRLQAWLDRTRIWRLTYRGIRVTDVPDRLKTGKIYLVGDDGYVWSAAMLCPGGCGKTLEMNLLPDAQPVWTVTEDANNRITLQPSVWLKTDCECHFILREGRIHWA